MTIKKHFLIELDLASIHSDPFPIDVANLIEKSYSGVIVKTAKELNEDDFIQETSSIDQSKIAELSRRRINLRNGNSSGKLGFGNVVKVKHLKNSPEMLLENIRSETDPDTKIQREVAQCSWFNNGVLQRTLFDSRHIEEVEVIESKKIHSNSQDVIMYGHSMNKLALTDRSIVEDLSAGRKINAIKTVRAHTDLGLKESKDMVEAVTTNMISNWNQGYFG